MLPLIIYKRMHICIMKLSRVAQPCNRNALEGERGAKWSKRPRSAWTITRSSRPNKITELHSARFASKRKKKTVDLR